MKTSEIYNRWMNYFKDKNHHPVESASLVSPDPSTLFTIAGMVPFIPYMTGVQKAPWKRATTIQKCVRTSDIDEVGKTTRHGTFFQMNGNFSFGDYFKEDAIKFAWDLVTGSQDEGKYGFDPDKIWVTVHKTDDETFHLWQEIAGLDKEKIQRRGDKDNYWSTGKPGPAGPCSEIYVDRGPEYGKDGGPVVDEDRFLEIWNLVFMQYQIDNVKSKTEFNIVGPLKNKNIDTGMGLERVAYLLQGKNNMYEIDQVYPVIKKTEEISGKTYGKNKENDVHFRVLADHIRSALMIVGDGIVPSNEGRGYVLRRLIRRSVWAMELLGVKEKAMQYLLPESLNVMKETYGYLEKNFDKISSIIYKEEDMFKRTLSSGKKILDTSISQIKSKDNANKEKISGDDAFKLHDTYGFPIDLTIDIAHENNVEVDLEGFKKLMQEQKDRARQDTIQKRQGGTNNELYKEFVENNSSKTEFCGYESSSSKAKVLGIFLNGKYVDKLSILDLKNNRVSDDENREFSQIEVVLDKTPFYAESGGQVADIGDLKFGENTLEIYDVQNPIKDLTVHKAIICNETLDIPALIRGLKYRELTNKQIIEKIENTNDEILFKVGDICEAQINKKYRHDVKIAHSATHMIHKALRTVLNEEATQAGAFTEANRARFDFHYSKPLTKEEIEKIELLVNEKIREALPVKIEVMSLDEAKNQGVTALFTEKYGEKVRVVSIGGEWSRELCKGTHVNNSSEICLATISNETSISSGTRRLEAVVGEEAIKSAIKNKQLLNDLVSSLGVSPEKIVERFEEMQKKIKDLQKNMSNVQAQSLNKSIAKFLDNPIVIKSNKINFIKIDLDNLASDLSADVVRNFALEVKNQIKDKNETVVQILSSSNGRIMVFFVCNDKAVKKGVKAGELIKNTSEVLNCRGGGKPDLAQGGGTRLENKKQSFEVTETFLKEI